MQKALLKMNISSEKSTNTKVAKKKANLAKVSGYTLRSMFLTCADGCFRCRSLLRSRAFPEGGALV